MKIGILDAGIGGLALAREVVSRFPDVDLVYFGDSARAPYGTKSADTVIRYALDSAKFLKSYRIGLLVIASHTISAICAERIGAEVGLPVLDAVAPTVADALHATRAYRIGVFGPPAVIACGIYPKRVRSHREDARVASSACPLLIPLIEAGWLKKPETAMILKKCLHPLKVRQVDTLIPGSAYYEALLKLIRKKIGKRVQVISPAGAQARALADYLSRHPQLDSNLSRSGSRQFFVSDLAGRTPRIANFLFGRSVKLEVASFRAAGNQQ